MGASNEFGRSVRIVIRYTHVTLRVSDPQALLLSAFNEFRDTRAATPRRRQMCVDIACNMDKTTSGEGLDALSISRSSGGKSVGSIWPGAGP